MSRTSLSRVVEYKSLFSNLIDTTPKFDEDLSPRVYETINIFKEKISTKYFTKKHKLFRVNTFHLTTRYLAWLDKIQAVKGDF